MSDSATAVKERPILMSGPMVRAILSGAKTQTRRVANTFASEYSSTGHLIRLPRDRQIETDERANPFCPHGRPGDRLYVKETWARGAADFTGGVIDAEPDEPGGWPVYYRADGERDASTLFRGRWKSPRFMPRWASRITLEIESVRVERLQAMSGHDAIEEGVEWAIRQTDDGPMNPLAAFRILWDSPDGKKPGRDWASNCWVWVIAFRRVESSQERTQS